MPETVSTGQIAPGARVRFQLTATLAAKGSAEALILKWDSSTLVVSSVALTVHDALGASNNGLFSGASGDQGYAEFWPDAARYEIYQMECP